MISRRKTIGTLCDALRTEDKARLKAIRSLLPKKSETAKNPVLSAFARQILQKAAKVPRSKRFGSDLVFISDVGTSPAFKNRLKEAYDQDLIELVKADMPQALPLEKIQKSKVKSRTVDLVFIRVPS